MAGTIATLAGGAAALASSIFDSQIPFLSSPKTNITAELGPKLSANASLHLPGSPKFFEATTRWEPWKQPTFDVVVQPATEEDIELTIRFANQHNKPFLAISGGHGGNVNLLKHQHGIGIWMRGMKDVRVAKDGKSATVGGGTLSGELIKTLWAVGKESVAGACECTGVTAPMLGGGHGWLQGRYGLMADNLISARLTFANGTTVTASDDSHPDLFWALRGAGHNFGIISSFEYKVYDRSPETDNWAYDIMIFRGDQVEDVFEVANTMIGGSVATQPVELIHFGLIMRNPEVDAENPILIFFLIWQGESVPAHYSKPLHALKPISNTPGVTDLPGFAAVVGFHMESPYCQPGGPAMIRSPVSLLSHHIKGYRQIYDKMAALPPSMSGSAYILEGYSTHGVQSVLDESTAYPDRASTLLLSPFFAFPPGDPELERQAEQHARELQEIPVNASGKPMNAYVNYANGMESQEALYGYDAWRLEKLRKLKREYDPEGKFGYYLPIEI